MPARSAAATRNPPSKPILSAIRNPANGPSAAPRSSHVEYLPSTAARVELVAVSPMAASSAVFTPTAATNSTGIVSTTATTESNTTITASAATIAAIPQAMDIRLPTRSDRCPISTPSVISASHREPTSRPASVTTANAPPSTLSLSSANLAR